MRERGSYVTPVYDKHRSETPSLAESPHSCECQKHAKNFGSYVASSTLQIRE